MDSLIWFNVWTQRSPDTHISCLESGRVKGLDIWSWYQIEMDGRQDLLPTIKEGLASVSDVTMRFRHAVNVKDTFLLLHGLVQSHASQTPPQV